MTTSTIEEVLSEIGIETRGDRQLRGLCPVHKMTIGREDTNPSWYCNAETGAWICFSCHARGSLTTLISMLGLDQEVLGRVPIEVMKSKVKNWKLDAIETTETEAPHETVFVSEYGFLKNPLPTKKAMAFRGTDAKTCELYNVRWDKAKMCWLLPIYHTDGNLLGWQEKSFNYFNNVPEEMEKRHALFGYQQFTSGTGIIVESPLDVLRLAASEIPGGLATLGSFVSVQQLDAIVRICDRVILAFDDDRAGHEAEEFVGQQLRDRGMLSVKYFQYPARSSRLWAKDPGELSLNRVRVGLASASMFRRKR